LAQPDAAVIVAADPAEVVVAQAKDGAVVHHAAVRIADRGVDHLPHRQLAHVARHRQLHERLGVGAGDLEFAQGRQVHHHGALAARPVFLDRPRRRETGGQPETAILLKVARQGGDARMKAGLSAQPGVCVRRHAVSEPFREGGVRIVEADMDVGGKPAVGRVDIVGAG
jgi:hypothetical protein